MKSIKNLIRLSLLITLVSLNSCKINTESKSETTEEIAQVKVYDFNNKQELAEYEALNLDKSHPNLLNPQISKADYDTVIASWTNLHQEIGTYLSENDFSWEVEDSTISIVQKIYFKPNGHIKHYFFRVLNENVPGEKKERYADLIKEFAKTHRIDYQLDQSFAQCGKTKYMN